MFRLLPRDEKFFELFEQQAGHIVSASRVLEELTLDYPSAHAKVQRTGRYAVVVVDSHQRVVVSFVLDRLPLRFRHQI